ncbi:response regulator [Catalinimonas sp. 4WD22]|uniref:response regulator n=1 Tax=Catalinimonas locisalis TaxID=3133978 RepID=UPI0031016B82
MHIYLIDNDEVDLIIGKKFLQILAPEAEVSTFQNPLKALSKLISSTSQPDVIILDWYMNELDAEAWIEYYITQVKDLAPVYIYTASINPQDKQKADSFEIVKGFYVKPFSKSAIEKILPKSSLIKH